MDPVKPAAMEIRMSDGTYSTNPIEWDSSDSYVDYYLSDDDHYDFEPVHSTATLTKLSFGTNTPTQKPISKTLSWGNLEEFCFAIEKGDPGVYELAYPLQLSNERMSEKKHTIDDYEQHRAPHRLPSDELHTKNSEERRKIIKASNKALAEFKKVHRRQLHRRQYSIGNGQMGRLFQAAKDSPGSPPQGKDDRQVQSE